MKVAAVLTLALAAALTACTTMGPMPIATGISSVPANRTSVEVQGGAISGYMLSDGAHADYNGRGTPLPQLSALIEPGDGVGVKGLIVGARRVGSDGDTLVEPFAGIRRFVDDDIAMHAIGFGSRASAAEGNADYQATRIGGEVGVDAKVVGNATVAVHAQASVSATGVWASGHYCVDTMGDGIDCNNDSHDTVVSANVSGLYGAATAGLSLDLFRDPGRIIHVIRLGAMMSAGAMPRLNNGEQQPGTPFLTGGATLTVGFGSR